MANGDNYDRQVAHRRERARGYTSGLIPSRWRGGGIWSYRRILDAAYRAAARGETVILVYPHLVIHLHCGRRQ